MDIQDKKYALQRVEQVNIIRPAPYKLRGTHKGKEYFVDAGISELPTGTAQVAPTITNDIAWDEALYLKWTANGSVDFYRIEITAGGAEVATYEGTDLFANFDDAVIGLVNGTEYSLQLTAIRGGTELATSPVLLTPAPKLVTGLTEVAVGDTTYEFNWTDLPTEYDHYDVYVTNTDTGILAGIYSTSTNSITLENLTYQANYEAYVVAVSELNIYTGPASAIISWQSVGPLAAPGTFAALAEQQGDSTWDVTYSWDSVALADGYNVYAQKDGGGYNKLNTSLITSLSYIDEDVGVFSWDAYVVAVRDGLEGASSSIVAFISSAGYNSLQFNGVDQYVTLPVQSFGSSLGQSTSEMWFRSDSTDKRYLFGEADDGFETIWFLQINGDRNDNASPGRMSFWLRDLAAKGRRYGTVNTHPINDGNWHHVAWSINGSTFKAYIDGVEVSIQISSVTSWFEPSFSSFGLMDYSLGIAASHVRGVVGNFCACAIKEFRLWDDVRTSTEIADNYNIELVGNEANLFGYWIFEGDTPLADLTSNGNDGTNFGGVPILDEPS